MTEIAIKIDAPVVTMARFSELTGIPFDTVKYRVHKGEYPIVPKKTPKERPQINMVAYHAQLAALAQLPKQQKR